MIRSLKGKGTTETKQEDEPNNSNNKTTNSAAAIAATSSSSSRQWSAFRNPRIVRVSRTFGGKDRHSKVCTIRGLRDRRIRLSVPTAIQLYDLQDRLGLTQPSKVIDWLLDNTKDDIDSLPPLQMPQGFNQFHPQFSPPISPFFDMNLHHHNSGVRMNSSSSFDAAEGSYTGKGKLVRTNEDEEEDQNRLSLSAAKLFPLAATNSSMPTFFNINNPPNVQLNPYNYNWDASNLSLSQFGMLPQNNAISLNANNGSSSTNSLPPPSSLAGAGGSPFFYCPPPATLPSFFPQYPPPFAHLENNETREISHFQLLNSGFGDSQRNSSARKQGQKDQNADP